LNFSRRTETKPEIKWHVTIEYWRWQGFCVHSAGTDVDCFCFAEDKIYSQIYNIPPEPKLNKDLQPSAYCHALLLPILLLHAVFIVAPKLPAWRKVNCPTKRALKRLRTLSK